MLTEIGSNSRQVQVEPSILFVNTTGFLSLIHVNSYLVCGSKVNLTVGSIDINLTVTLRCMLFLSPCRQQVWPLIFISVDKVVHTTDCGTDHITVSEYLHGGHGGQSGSTPHQRV